MAEHNRPKYDNRPRDTDFDPTQPCPLCGTDPWMIHDIRLELTVYRDRLESLIKRLQESGAECSETYEVRFDEKDFVTIEPCRVCGINKVLKHDLCNEMVMYRNRLDALIQRARSSWDNLTHKS